MLLLLTLGFATSAQAHEFRPAVATLVGDRLQVRGDADVILEADRVVVRRFGPQTHEVILRRGEETILLTEASPSASLSSTPELPWRDYLRLGFLHVLGGWDHLAFLLGLLMLIERRRTLLLTVTAFTAAHSLTLALTVYRVINVSPTGAELVIALSVLFVAREILSPDRSVTKRFPFVIAFTFGLIHGVGFAGAFSALGVTRPLTLLAFNVGVELGQIAVLLVALPLLRALPKRPVAYVVGALAAAMLLGCPDDKPTFPDEREDCADRNAQRNLYFGDLHVHTANSFDAWVFDVRNTPDDAYRFARGEPLTIPPGVTVQLDRPLDFAAVTDHAEYLGEVSQCSTPGSPGYDSGTCVDYRAANADVVTEFGLRLTEEPPSRFGDVCGGGRGADCTDRARTVWQRIQDSAEAAYDRTDECGFTSFVAYEYTAVTAASNLHRNVIFRNEQVPAFPAAYFEFPRPQQLFEHLRRSCLEDGSRQCDVVSIPHNTNWSNGNLFVAEYPGASSLEEEREAATLRGVVEPLLEVFQHKGDGECMNGLSGIAGQPDEFCNFEKLRNDPSADCGDETGFGGAGGVGCISRVDFLRGILLEGLKEERRLGVNPYRLGVIASTDSHNGTPGLVDEKSYVGHWGNNEDSTEKRLGRGNITPGGIIFNGGGLTAVWAEENSRNAIFDALKRREVYGTSGPRISVRFFGGPLPDGLCAASDLVGRADDAGVPMGGTTDQAKFVVSALKDPEGNGLEKIQIIKGWLGENGPEVKVFDVATAETGTVTADCVSSGGVAALCAEWTDPDPSPGWYYARVLEVPSCRWSRWACNAIPPAERPASCTDPEIPTTIRERAWSSPIWLR